VCALSPVRCLSTGISSALEPFVYCVSCNPFRTPQPVAHGAQYCVNVYSVLTKRVAFKCACLLANIGRSNLVTMLGAV
jgi:hypothetical protein